MEDLNTPWAKGPANLSEGEVDMIEAEVEEESN